MELKFRLGAGVRSSDQEKSEAHVADDVVILVPLVKLQLLKEQLTELHREMRSSRRLHRTLRFLESLMRT